MENYINKEKFINDIINRFDWIKFWCWGLSIQSLTVLFVGIITTIGIILGSLISSWIIINFSTTYFLPILFIGLFFAYIAYRRWISWIQVYINSVVIRKYRNIICTMKYELNPEEIEYVEFEKNMSTYGVTFKTKNGENVVINHIKDWEKLQDYLNAIWIVTSYKNQGISNHKIWYDAWVGDDGLQHFDTKSFAYKSRNRYYCQHSFCIEKSWILLIYLLPYSGLFFINYNINISKILLSISIFATILLIIWSIISRNGSFVELDGNSIKIRRYTALIIKNIKTIEYRNIDKVEIKVQHKSPLYIWYNVYLYLKNFYWLKQKYIFFNVDNWIKFKNELKLKWINVSLSS